MTVHRRSYRPFEGERRPPGRLFWAITRRELRLGFKKKWVRRLLILAGIPLVGFMVMLYAQLVVERTFNARFLGTQVFEEFYSAEVFFVVLMMAALGADVIAKDVAARAHALYFSRPLTAAQYLWGKLAAVAAVLALLIVAPGLLLALAQLLLAPEQNWGEFARLSLGIVAYGALLSVCAAALIACLSAFGSRSRFVGAVWVGVYFFSGAASGGLAQVTNQAEWVRVVSIHNLFVDTGRFFFSKASPGLLAPVVLVVLALLATVVLYQRVRTLERSEQ